MIKDDLKDTSFLIYTRVDSEDRLTNLELVIGHIRRYLNTSIVLWEMDIEPKIPKKIKELEGLSYRFLEDIDSILHTTKYRNAMVQQCGTPYFFLCDTDVIVAPKALIKCTEYLRKVKGKTLIYPYDGDFYNVPKDIRETYAKFGEYEFLKVRQEMFQLWFKYSTGGIFGGRTIDFRISGPDNEAIYGWGPDDLERYYRLKREGFTIKRAETPLYHLNHDRNANSWYVNKETRTRNEQEYLKNFQNG